MPSAAFQPATQATKRPQTYALDRTATGIGHSFTVNMYILNIHFNIMLPYPLIYPKLSHFKRFPYKRYVAFLDFSIQTAFPHLPNFLGVF
jgi:hypothetical protein